ncbi:MAG: hypothetical protein F4Z39_04755 [Chloroflexi bacterium]|nr:hypothetical protein [Chloroflexota bacterium]
MNPRPRPRLFALLWLVAGLGVVPLSITLLYAALDGIRWLAEYAAGAPLYDLWGDNFALLTALAGVICGFCVGVLQQVIISRAWRVKLAGWWRASTLGGLLGGLFVWLLIEIFEYHELLWSMDLSPTQYSTLPLALPMLAVIMCLATSQASKLRRQVSVVGAWLAAHALAVLLPLFCSYLFFEPIDPEAIYTMTLSATWFMSHFVLLTIFTGVVMRRIASRGAWRQTAKRKSAGIDLA